MSNEVQIPEVLEKQLKEGDTVIYFDEFGRQHTALLVAIWGERAGVIDGSTFASNEPSVNLLFVSPDEKRTDTNGRQIERRSSCMHVQWQSGWGNCWCLEDQIEEAIAKTTKSKEEFQK